MQTVLAILVGIIALIYVINIFGKQLFQAENNPKCEHCPIPELHKKKK